MLMPVKFLDTSANHFYMNFIDIYGRCVYPMPFTVHSKYTFYQYTCPLDIEPVTFVLLTQCIFTLCTGALSNHKPPPQTESDSDVIVLHRVYFLHIGLCKHEYICLLVYLCVYLFVSGPHCFIVPIRDQNGVMWPGVSVIDMKHKEGNMTDV